MFGQKHDISDSLILMNLYCPNLVISITIVLFFFIVCLVNLESHFKFNNYLFINLKKKNPKCLAGLELEDEEGNKKRKKLVYN